MKLLSTIYCLLFTLCPVFASESPSDPINTFEIEKQRRSELSLIDDRGASNKSAPTEFKPELLKSGKLISIDDALSLLDDSRASNKSAPTEFKSELFKSGKLIYSDDFNGAINKEFWGQPKGKKIKDGILTVGPLFKSKEEAMKALKRDHHLGLEPVVHINRIPEKFVMHLRYQFAKPELTPGRPSFQIGHHMINLGIVKDGGHRVKLPDGPSFFEPESDMALNKWIDLVIEYELGKIRVLVNGHGNTYEHEKVTIINPKDKLGPRFTFKGGPECEILFDYVRLWDCTD
jgi:hypothetical protein